MTRYKMVSKKHFLLALVLLIGIEFLHCSASSAGDLDGSWWVQIYTPFPGLEIAFDNNRMYLREFPVREWTPVTFPYLSFTGPLGITRYCTFHVSLAATMLVWGNGSLEQEWATFNAAGLFLNVLPAITLDNATKPSCIPITTKGWSLPRHLTVTEGVNFYEGAMATDGTYMWHVPPNWRVKIDYLIKEDLEGNNLDYISVPVGNVTELTFDGKDLWYCDYIENATPIYKIDLQGNLLGVIQVPFGWIKGLAFDGANLWCATESFYNYDKKIYESKNAIYQIDTKGNILKSFDLWFGDPAGLAFDGKTFWCPVEAEQAIYRLDTDGNVIGILYSPYASEYLGYNDYLSDPMSLAISGNTLWVVGSGEISTDRYTCDISDIIGTSTGTTTIETTSTTTTIPDGTGRLDTIESIFENMVTVPAGAFDMGGGICSDCFRDDQFPVHTVTLSSSYKMTAYEITQGQWQAVMGSNPSHYNECGSDCPVEQISWKDIELFIRKLKELTGLSYRLPTEAEWEYAARAGTNTLYPCGDNETCLKSIAWYADTAGGITHPVGQKQANAWGLYDMNGNVREWVQDRYYEGYYEESPETDPPGPTYFEGYNQRAMRGGGIFSAAIECQSADRDYNYETFRGSDDVGFRLCLSSDNRTFPEPRFIDNNNGTVTDKRTGLVWLKNASPCGKKTWFEAEMYCAGLAHGIAGLSDGSFFGQWRLPEPEELQGLGTDPPEAWLPFYYNYPLVLWTMPGEPFTDVQPYNYWSHQISGSYGLRFTTAVSMSSGFTGEMINSYKYYVWPVRDAK